MDVEERKVKYGEEWGYYRTDKKKEANIMSLHREDDKPASITTVKKNSWYEHNRLHRKNGPAIDRSDGSKEWFLNGLRMNTRGNPNVVREDKSREHVIYYSLNDKPSLISQMDADEDKDNIVVYHWHNEYGLHRGNDNPARIFVLEMDPHIVTQAEWWHNGKKHREGAPAIIEYKNGTPIQEEFYTHGKRNTVADVRLGNLECIYYFESLETLEMDVDMSKTAYDGTRDISIRRYLKEDPDNIVFLFKTHVFLSTKTTIHKMLELGSSARESSIAFECYKEDTALIPRDTNVNRTMAYMLTRTFIAFDVLIPLFQISKIIYPYTDEIVGDPSRIYLISDEPDDSARAVTTLNMLDNPNANASSSTHCGKKTGRDIHTLFEVVNTKKDDLEASAEEESDPEAKAPSSTLTVIYKEVKYPLPITTEYTIGELKRDFLNILIENRVISNANNKVKFMFGGKLFMEDATRITEMSDPPFDIKIHAMVSPLPVGTGRRLNTRKRRRPLTSKKRKYKKTKGPAKGTTKGTVKGTTKGTTKGTAKGKPPKK